MHEPASRERDYSVSGFCVCDPASRAGSEASIQRDGEVDMHRIRCSEVWGGIQDVELDVATSGLTVSLYSAACDGGKGGDVYYFSVCGSDKLTRIAVADVAGHGEAVSHMSQWLYDAPVGRINSFQGKAILPDLNSA